MLRKSILGMFLLAVLGPVGSAFAGEQDLVAWYKFDGNARDSSGNGLDGTEHGAPVYAEGRYGMAIDMDGVDDYIDCGNDSKFDITTAITISYWFTVEAFDREWNTIIAKGEGSWRSSRADLNNYMEFALSGTSGNSLYSSTPVDDGLWHHAAATFDGTTTKTYIDGVLDTTEASTGTISISGSNVFIGDNSGATGRYWNGKIDDLRIYSRALPQSEILDVMAGRTPEQAQNPSPEKEATDVPRDVVLSWTAGDCAATHTVYFGTNFEDVNDGNADVLVSEGQTNAAYDPDVLLEYGQTYYWRIDEVNAAPDYTVFEGRTWSFTTETYSYPITNLTATASAEQGNSLASYTIDNSGINEYDQHGVDLSTMWCTPSGGLPAWIQYEFDKQYRNSRDTILNCLRHRLRSRFSRAHDHGIALNPEVSGLKPVCRTSVPDAHQRKQRYYDAD